MHKKNTKKETHNIQLNVAGFLIIPLFLKNCQSYDMS